MTLVEICLILCIKLKYFSEINRCYSIVYFTQTAVKTDGYLLRYYVTNKLDLLNFSLDKSVLLNIR